ncbi:hypothetical protein GLOIN_2v1535567 [Rhizophagus clarus]|uniref:Uncharacterized protein n=1 Tax=Rhizophagus clarus TaxID=94130 RepID=A0A8H3KVF5_9GLOM|nr:hypothetical protein GLOIN_2v1535567 [Rhizophagus clarus]
MSFKKQTIQLLSLGSLVPTFYYGVYSVNWWTFTDRKILNEKKQICIPLRLNMRVQLELNKTIFIVRIVSAEDGIKPGYICESDVASKVYFSASEAVNKTYNNLFNNKTRYSGPSVLGFDNENITQELLSDVLFCSFKITVDKLIILIIKLSDSNDNMKKERIAYYSDISLTEVWKKTGILKNYDGGILFGIEHSATINALKIYAKLPICSVNEWDNIEIMTQAFKWHLKRQTTILDLNWHKFFIEWKEQESNIIEFMVHLKPLYPLNYKFNDRELRAWRLMMKSVGCTNIMPYKKEKSKPEFWTCAVNSSSDSTALLYLFNKNLLNGVYNNKAEFKKENNQLKIIIDKFWKCFKEAIKVNKSGLDGKQRILSIITEKFGFREIQKKLQTSNDLISASTKYSRINSPGCPAKIKPVVTQSCISEIKDREFESFFSDKENVTMSSYHVDLKTNLPLLYLKDSKETLWQKFEAAYPDGIKRTSFMACLASGQYVYRKDLGGLCNICNEYCYKVFDTLISLARLHVEKESRNSLVNELEKLRHHLKRGFENELIVNEDGTVPHMDTINHCLLYVFRECTQEHKSRCAMCDQLFVLLEHLTVVLPENFRTIIEESRNKLCYFLAHQARKVYLNNQFKAKLLELDDDGVILVCDYKMRILPKSACETKEQFFGKRGWTLHTILVFTKYNASQLNVQAFDHWSTDTKQDAWFIASSFDAVFETLDPKPKWIKIFSDNGGHYHNSELMTVVANWNHWYEIDIRGWHFFESGEAKSSVDSHHAQIAHSIKRYVRVGYNLDNGEKIEDAIKNLGGTSVAHLEPKRNHVPVKTISGITKLSYFEWPIEGPFIGYIQAQTLPHIGEWSRYSPTDISKLIDESLHKPTPDISTHTKPNLPWNFPIVRIKDKTNKSMLEIGNNTQICPTDISDKFQLENGWALKSNQKYGQRGVGKRITVLVKAYLKGFFLAGNVNKTDRMSAKDMYIELNKLAEEGEIQKDEVPEIKTIEGWITRYSASLRKESAEQRVIGETNKRRW